MKPVETINFTRNPSAVEYRKQKRVVALKGCRHLQGHSLREYTDRDRGTIESFYSCDTCGKILSDKDIKKINKIIKAYSDVKKSVGEAIKKL